MNGPAAQWQVANQDHLMAALEIVRLRLESWAGIPREDTEAVLEREARARQALPAPSALQQIEVLFTLTAFERELLLLCAAMETLPVVADLCARLHKNPLANYPTFGLALAYLQEPSWISISPEGPLRRFRLIEVEDGMSLTRSRLRMPERVLHYLCGVSYVDPALAALEPAPPAASLAPIQQRLVERVTAAVAHSRGPIPPIQLIGPGGRAVAASAAAGLGLAVYRVRASELPADPRDWGLLWTREALLLSAALVIEVDQPEAAARASASAAHARSPLFVVTDDRLAIDGSRVFEAEVPTAGETEAIWRSALGAAADGLNGSLATLSTQFRLDRDQIVAAAAAATESGEALADALWSECRWRSRPPLDGFVQRIESSAGWDDIVLPDAQMSVLRQIVSHVRHRATVYDAWGFGPRASRGLGISALFAGPSGTGKTLAAEVIAGALRLDLYRIDLSQVVSKYIGDTEKNLRRVFAAAEGSGAVLVFDEADALFGKRSEVRDSHDRYANIEVGYLLQRMELYHGLVILTSNLKQALDSAFLRRLRFVVQFPFPELEDRRRIWQRVFPAAMPSAGIDVDRLAGLSLTGGNIRNVALNAAFLAADEGRAVGMPHLVRAARGEFAKLERPMAEIDAVGAG